MQYLFLLFVLMPIIEIWLILKVGGLVGVLPTVLLIIGTAMVGTFMLRREGFATLFRAKQKMAEGSIPAHEMAEGIMLAFAGALLLTPGFVTDAIGFSLLLPVVRRTVIKQFSTKIQNSSSGFTYYSSSQSYSAKRGKGNNDSDIIEGEFSRDSKSNSDYQRIDKSKN